MVVLTDLPTELHCKIIQYMVTITERNHTPRLVNLAGVSPYWKELAIDAMGKRVGELWKEEEAKAIKRQERMNAALAYALSAQLRVVWRWNKAEKARRNSKAKKLKRLEKAQHKLTMWQSL